MSQDVLAGGANKPTRMSAFTLRVLILGVAIALILFFNWAFPIALGINYLSWYLKNGSAVFLGFALVSLVWNGLDKVSDLISADPIRFTRGYMVLYAGVASALSSILAPSRSGSFVSLINGVPAILFAVWLALALLMWLVLIAPLQYMLHIFTGIPARAALDSVERTWMIVDEKGFEIISGPAVGEAPAGAIESGFSAKPVALTTALDSVLIWVLAQFVGPA